MKKENEEKVIVRKGSIMVDYGGGERERYDLDNVCMIEFGKGSDLFESGRMIEMGLKPEALYAVITQRDDTMEIFEPLEDVAIFFCS